MRKDKQKKENSLLSLLPLAEVFLVGAVAFVLLVIFVVIFLSAQRLGGWFFPVLFAYFAILALAAAYLYHRKELLQLHALVGDETFYRLYPKEKKRDERRAERFRRKLQRDKERRMKRKDEL